MKVSDLVELSWRGKSTEWCTLYQNCVGVVVDVQPKIKRLHNVRVMWMNIKNPFSYHKIMPYQRCRWISRNYLKIISKG